MTTEGFVSWINQKVIDVDEKIRNDEYKNYDEVNNDLNTIEQFIESTATASKKKGALSGYDKIKSGYLQPEMDDAVDKVNREIITERTTDIQKATTIKDIEKAVPIEINYLDETVEKISATAETRKTELFESQIDEARGMIIGVGSADEIRNVLRMFPSEIRDKVGAKQKLDRLIRAELEPKGTTIGRL